MARKTATESEDNLKAYFKELDHCNPLSREEEVKLWKRYKYHNDIKARNRLITANLKYVVKVAKNYMGMGLSYSDLIAEGNMGLVRAIEKYDGTRGVKTLSYSIWWIRQSILEALNKRNGIDSEDLPRDNEKPLAEEAYDVETDETPDYDDTGEFSHDEDNACFEKKEILKTLLHTLSDKEQQIITDYFGLGGRKPLTLEEIGDELGITKERVRQINEKALLKLRSEALNYSL